MHFNTLIPFLGLVAAASTTIYEDPVNGNVNEGTIGYDYMPVLSNYVATSSQTVLTILSRHDNGHFLYDDFTLMEAIEGVAPNLIQNGGFESGVLAPWVLVTQAGATPEEMIISQPVLDHGAFALSDGALGGFDAVSQLINTPVAPLLFTFSVASSAGMPALSQVILSDFGPPSIALADGSDTGDSSSDGITNSITVTGSTAPGQVITIYANGAQVATTTTGLDGTYTKLIDTSTFPFGTVTLTATTSIGDVISGPSNTLTLVFVPPGTYTLNAAVTGRTPTSVTITGSTPEESNRALTYDVTSSTGTEIVSGGSTSDANGAFTITFATTEAGTISITGTDIAGNPLQKSVAFEAAIAPPTTSTSLSSSTLSTMSTSTTSVDSPSSTSSIVPTSSSSSLVLSLPSSLLPILSLSASSTASSQASSILSTTQTSSMPATSTASKLDGIVEPIGISPITVTSTITLTVPGTKQTVVAVQIFINGAPALSPSTQGLTADQGQASVLVSISNVLVAVSASGIGSLDAAIVSGATIFNGVAPVIITVITIVAPVVFFAGGSIVTTTTTAQGYVSVVAGGAGLAPGMGNAGAITLLHSATAVTLSVTQTIAVASTNAGGATVVPDAGIAGIAGVLVPPAAAPYVTLLAVPTSVAVPAISIVAASGNNNNPVAGNAAGHFTGNSAASASSTGTNNLPVALGSGSKAMHLSVMSIGFAALVAFLST